MTDLVAVTHAFVNPQPDGPDPTVTRPSDWNNPHVIDQTALEAALAGVVQRVTVHLTSAQILTLFSDPPELVTSPGAGKILVPSRAVLQFKPGVYRYAFIGGLFISLVPNDPDQQNHPFGLAINDPATTEQVDSMLAWFLPIPYILPSSQVSSPVADYTDKPLVFWNDQGNDPVPFGPIATASVAAGGAGYAPGDTGQILADFPIGVSNYATYTVLTVTGGAVATFSVANADAVYSVNGGLTPFPAPTFPLTGGGDGNFTVSVDSLVGSPDGDFYGYVEYDVWTPTP